MAEMSRHCTSSLTMPARRWIRNSALLIQLSSVTTLIDYLLVIAVPRVSLPQEKFVHTRRVTEPLATLTPPDYIVAMDFGGTKIHVATADLRGNLLHQEI